MQLRFHHLELPLIKPIKTAWGNFNKKPVIIVEAHDDKVSGFGEIPCLPYASYAGFSADDIVATVKDLKLNSKNYEDILSDSVPSFNAIFFGIQAALFNHDSSMNHYPCDEFFVPIIKVYGESWDLSLIEDDLIKRNYTSIKIKITDPSSIKALSLLRHLDSTQKIIVDCNQCLNNIHQADEIIEILPHCFLEEPFNTPELSLHYSNRVIFDESATSIESIKSLHLTFPAAHFSIKPFRFRNIQNLKVLNEMKYPLSLGGMYETGVGRHYNLFLAQELKINSPCEISERGSYFIKEITVDNHEVNNGRIKTPSHFTIDYKNFKKYLIETIQY